MQSQRPEAREPAPGWEKQHPYRWLWHGLPAGGRQSVRDQLRVSSCSVCAFLNNSVKEGQSLYISNVQRKSVRTKLNKMLHDRECSCWHRGQRRPCSVYHLPNALFFLLFVRSPHYACPEVIRVSVLLSHAIFLEGWYGSCTIIEQVMPINYSFSGKHIVMKLHELKTDTSQIVSGS